MKDKLVNATKEEIGQGAPGDGEEAPWFHPEQKGRLDVTSHVGRFADGESVQPVLGCWELCKTTSTGARSTWWELHDVVRTLVTQGQERYRDDKDGNEDQSAEGEEAASPGCNQEKRALGNEVVMRSLDDFVTPNDAYVHNLLTSGRRQGLWCAC
eukprot:768468-Hanusia_phi.AAC.2